MVENTNDNAVLEYIYKIIADIKKTSATYNVALVHLKE